MQAQDDRAGVRLERAEREGRGEVARKVRVDVVRARDVGTAAWDVRARRKSVGGVAKERTRS